MGYLFNTDIIKHIHKLTINFTHEKNLAYLNQQINNDANALVIFCLEIINNFLVNLISLPILFIICFQISPSITMVFIFISIIYVFIYKLIKDIKFKFSYEFKETQNIYFSKLFEQLEYISFIKSQSIEDFFIKRVELPFKNLLNSVKKNTRITFLFTGIDSIVFLASQIFLYIIGAYYVYIDEFTVGNFVVLSTYYNLIISSIRFFFSFAADYKDKLVSYNRIQSIMNIPIEPEGDKIAISINSISINKLNFSYTTNALIENFSCTFTKGKIYGLLGKNGSGKSTFAKLLLGLLNEGVLRDSIVINNNIDILDINKNTLRRNLISYGEQSPILFEDSILANIQMNNETVENLSDILNKFNINEMLDEKTSTNIDSLSGGEKQKIELARVFSKKSDLIILDEPSSSIDIKTKEVIVDFLNEIKKDRIVIIITHEEKIIENCDCTVYFE